jgi:hypothetical protein
VLRPDLRKEAGKLTTRTESGESTLIRVQSGAPTRIVTKTAAPPSGVDILPRAAAAGE